MQIGAIDLAAARVILDQSLVDLVGRCADGIDVVAEHVWQAVEFVEIRRIRNGHLETVLVEAERDDLELVRLRGFDQSKDLLRGFVVEKVDELHAGIDRQGTTDVDLANHLETFEGLDKRFDSLAG